MTPTNVLFIVSLVAMVSPTIYAGKQSVPIKMVLTGTHAITIPTRFLALLAHFFITVCLLWDKGEYFQLCSIKYNEEYATYYHREYILTLVLSLGCVVVELSGFLCGCSMFSELHCIYSSVCHAVAAFVWSISYNEKWDCSSPYNWYIFLFCLTIPLLTELAVIVASLSRTTKR